MRIRLLEEITTLLKRSTRTQWDRFALWLLSGDGPLSNVDPKPSCLILVVDLYEGRLLRKYHDARYWLDAHRCLSNVALGERHSPCCDQRSRRRRISGRFAASAASNAAFVYAAHDYNPQRYSSPLHLVVPKVHAITDACSAHAWTSGAVSYSHRRDDNVLVALEDCRVELESLL